MNRRSLNVLVLAVLALHGCRTETSLPGSGFGQGDPSSMVMLLPSPFLAGYERDLYGEILAYHSPIPSVGTSLLVRSEDRARSIGWESQAVPDTVAERGAVFAFMLGVDVNQEPRSFDFLADGTPLFQITNPTQVSAGDTILWEGEGGVEARFHVTLLDRYGDAMGFLFLRLPRARLNPGRRVRFEVRGESAGVRTWLMVFRDPIRPSVSLRNAPAVLRTPEGEVQVLRLDLLSLEEGRSFSFRSPVGGLDITATLGHTRLTLPVPAVATSLEVPVEVRYGEHEESLSYRVLPVRRMEIYLLHHTHLDIGYTHHQDEVEKMQWGYLEESLQLGEASQGNPEGARFVWNPEGIWAVDTYVRAHPGEMTERLAEGIRRGWIELDGMYAGLLTGLANEETLLHAFDAARGLSAMTGVPVESEMLSDIPGFSWGLVEALARNGIRYLSIGPNSGHRIGHFTERLGDRPFYWEGASGEHRVLTWVSGAGYAWFHTGLDYDTLTVRLDEEKVFQVMDQLASKGYPYDLTYLRYNIGSDNGPPDPGLAEAVLEWNRRYASPTLRISGTTEVFREFERRYGEGLPTYRGDMTGYWEDGAASSARETGMVRRVSETLPQIETLAEIRGVPLDSSALADAWRNVLLYYEHTWGSWNSVSEPFSELTLSSWNRKRSFAQEASKLTGVLKEQALEGGEGRSGEVEVFNTLDWERTDLVVISQEASGAGDRVVEVGGGETPSQRLSGGELAFLARSVPPRSSRTYRIEAGGGPGGRVGVPEEMPDEGGDAVLRSREYAIRVGAKTGTITSLVHRGSGVELVASEDPGLNQYVYVPGRDPLARVTSRGSKIRWRESGPLVWSVEVTADAPGLREPLVAEITLAEGVDRVDLTNTLAKEWVLDPEAVLFRFPFALKDPEVWIDAPFGAFRPEVDQVPGSAKNYFSLQRWVDLSDAGVGVTVTSVDAPLIQLGEVRTDGIVTGWLETAESSPVLYSYVMNNYWETNYRAAQDDRVRFHYAIRAHGPLHKEAAARFGLEQARPLVVRIGGR